MYYCYTASSCLMQSLSSFAARAMDVLSSVFACLQTEPSHHCRQDNQYRSHHGRMQQLLTRSGLLLELLLPSFESLQSALLLT